VDGAGSPLASSGNGSSEADKVIDDFVSLLNKLGGTCADFQRLGADNLASGLITVFTKVVVNCNADPHIAVAQLRNAISIINAPKVTWQ
jgi:hypothetical protein